jgi:hypothetical protein
MHRVLDAACRRTAGIAAGVVVVGGVAGAVLLTPGTAFASGPDTTTTTITNAQVASTPGGATITVSVQVDPADNSNGTVTGTVHVSAGPGSCDITLSQVGAGPDGSGTCSFGLPFGHFSLTATYEGVANLFDSSSSQTVSLVIGNSPVFSPAFPSRFVTAGQSYSANFHASGVPDPRYSLVGAPSFLHINPFTGTVFGTVPTFYFAGEFSYSVVASNPVGSAIIGPFTVFVRHVAVSGHLSTNLNCSPKVFSGQRGSCTLYVTDHGGRASNVTAQIALPSQLRADFCRFNFGCSIQNNTAFENLGTLNPDQTKSLTVVFTARTASFLWGFHPRHAFTVKVVGSASSSGGFPFIGHSTSNSFAFVTIIPRFF